MKKFNLKKGRSCIQFSFFEVVNKPRGVGVYEYLKKEECRSLCKNFE